jgi:hypothetical protein
MAKKELKTKQTKESVTDFLKNYPNPKLTNDYLKLLELFNLLTKVEPILWGKIVGYGTYKYKRSTGQEYQFLALGFAPSKKGFTIYSIPGYDAINELMKKLGKYTTGKSCLYIAKLEDIDIDILEKIIIQSINYMKENNNAKF